MIYNYQSIDHYYRDSSSEGYVRHVGIPLLCLNAEDDPFLGSFPHEEAQHNEHLIFALTVILEEPLLVLDLLC